MHPDAPSPAHLPAPQPPTAALLHRAQGTLGLLREVVRESSAEYWYERGKEAMAREGWEDAQHSLEKCIKADNSYWRGLLQLAVTLGYKQTKADETPELIQCAFENYYPIKSGFASELSIQQWNKIYEIIVEISNQKSDDYNPILSLAIISWARGETDSTVKLLDKLSFLEKSIFQKQSTIWNRLSGRVGNGSGYDFAHYFDYALTITNNKSIIYKERGDYKSHSSFADERAEAIIDYGLSIELYPNCAEIYLSSGNLRLEAGDFQGAINDFGCAIEIEPENYEHYYQRSVANYKNNNQDAMKLDYQKAYDLFHRQQ